MQRVLATLKPGYLSCNSTVGLKALNLQGFGEYTYYQKSIKPLLCGLLGIRATKKLFLDLSAGFTVYFLECEYFMHILPV